MSTLRASESEWAAVDALVKAVWPGRVFVRRLGVPRLKQRIKTGDGSPSPARSVLRAAHEPHPLRRFRVHVSVFNKTQTA